MVENRPDPLVEISERLKKRKADLAIAERHDAAYSNARLALFAIIAGLAWFSFGEKQLPGWSVLPPIAVFAILVTAHSRLLKRKNLLRRAVRFFEESISRIEERWSGSGRGGEQYAEEHHPYALDLDLFGKGSMFELLCAARTLPGEETLASWLLSPAAPSDLRQRQQAIIELADKLDLREEMAILGEDVRAEVDAKLLSKWGEKPPILPGNWLRIAAAGLALVNVASLAGWALGYVSPLFFCASIAIELILVRITKSRLAHILSGVDRPARELEILALLLHRLEKEKFSAEKLLALQARFRSEGRPAASRIESLRRLADLLEWTRNELFAIIGFLVLWKLQVGLAIEAWRKECGPRIREWMSALGELEAISSLGAYYFEHPKDQFAEIDEIGAHPRFEGAGLGHPLLPSKSNVRNDLAITSPSNPILIVSGSNMSGKSTLLRTVGINAVLAFAGCPVKADRLVLTPFKIGATLRIQDSLQGGRSKFFAEISKIKQISDLASDGPFLFLLDEILHGTNSQDRRIGGEAVLGSLVSKGALGLVTTHDLTLTELVHSMPGAKNAHFEDSVIDDKVIFDYKLRPGVVAKSNALALMRAVGLEFCEPEKGAAKLQASSALEC